MMNDMNSPKKVHSMASPVPPIVSKVDKEIGQNPGDPGARLPTEKSVIGVHMMIGGGKAAFDQQSKNL